MISDYGSDGKKYERAKKKHIEYLTGIKDLTFKI
jgi:hypothetical protein